MSMKVFFSLWVMMSVFAAAGNCAAPPVNWKEYKAQHFVIYYKNISQDFLKEVEKSAESYYYEITQNLGLVRYDHWTWEKRAKIYIYDDNEDFVKNGDQAGWAAGVASAHGKIIQTFPAAFGFFDSTLPHEMAHIIFREFVTERADVPLWFEEGVAMLQEKAKRYGVDKFVQSAMEKNEFIPLTKIHNMRLYKNSDSKDVELYYAESASVVHYMMSELGESRFVQFCRALKEGLSFEEALGKVYYRFKTIDDLNKAWINFLK